MIASSRPSSATPSPPDRASMRQIVAVVLSWTAVSLPLAWGVSETLRKTLALFQ